MNTTTAPVRRSRPPGHTSAETILIQTLLLARAHLRCPLQDSEVKALKDGIDESLSALGVQGR